jgi:hypothetical protein
VSLLKRALGLGTSSGRRDDDAVTFWTTPWAWRDNDGLYRSHDGDVWLYRELAVNPMRWEDPSTRIELGSPLSGMLYELAATSKDLGSGLRSLAKSREFHLLAITWEEPINAPADTPPGLRPMLEDLTNYVTPRRAVVIGVKLWSSQNAVSAAKAVVDAAMRTTTKLLGEEGFDTEPFDADRKVVAEICRRYGAWQPPRLAVRTQMESWYNNGQGPDATIIETRDNCYIGDFDRLEFAAVMGFDNQMMQAPDDAWALTAQTAAAPASVISVRGQLDPATVARARVRQSQRRVRNQIEEEQATDDIDRPEHAETFHLAQTVEQFIVSGNEPLISGCSIIMARRVDAGIAETYIDELRNDHGIELKPLENRQLAALEETLPCGRARVNPFLQDVFVNVLAHAGLQGFSNLGDASGVFCGLVDPDYTPAYLNPLGAPARELPPSMLVAGDPGSGKTMLLQLLASQMAHAGLSVIFVNPKGHDSLAGLMNVVPGTRRVALTDIEAQGGYFDPFRFTAPTPDGRRVAADIAGQHILAVLGSRGVAGLGFDQAQEIALLAGLREGAERGARCVAEALTYVPDAHVRDMVLKQAADPLFRLGIGGIDGTVPPPYHQERGLLLIEFDRPLDFPEKGTSPAEYTRTQRLGIAAVRLVTRASMEILGTSGGGAMFVDEAWMFLQSQEGLAALQSLGRLGRSQNILPVFATQRVDDLLRDGVDMQGYISRAFVLKLNEEREATAGLKLIGLDPTPSRIAWLRNAGPRRDETGTVRRGAMGIHMDLDRRHSAVLVAVPERYRMAFSTNPLDKARNQELREQAVAAAADAAPASTPAETWTPAPQGAAAPDAAAPNATTDAQTPGSAFSTPPAASWGDPGVWRTPD